MTADPHKNYFDAWQTPPEWVEWARETMGGIDLDPCSTDDGEIGWSNLTKSDDGLEHHWHGRVYCNPPGDRQGKSVPRWWGKARGHLLEGDLESLVFCFFNWEAVISARPDPLLVDGWLVLPVRRVSFLRDGKAVKSPRNRAAFWTSTMPAQPPVTSYIVPTGQSEIGTYFGHLRSVSA
jgi:hypothetical protein